jgi:hypothetical protein
MRIKELAVGAVLHDRTLTTVVRHGSVLARAEVGRVQSSEAAAHVLMQLKLELRADGDAAIFLDANHMPDLGHVHELLRQHDDPHGNAQLVYGLSAAHTCAPSGIEYANRRSELFDRYLHQLYNSLLVPPDELMAVELEAFAVGERDGKIVYPSPVEVAEKINRYPARALAAVLSTIPAPPPGALKNRARPFDYDPYANL